MHLGILLLQISSTQMAYSFDLEKVLRKKKVLNREILTEYFIYSSLFKLPCT